MKYFKPILFTLCLLLAAQTANAQLFGKKKKKTSVSGFTLKESPSAEDVQKAKDKRLVNPVRKIASGFNLHVAKGLGYFSNQYEVISGANPETYKYSGRINPWIFRLDYSFKKVDTDHLKRTGEKRYLDQDRFRIGGGIGFGKFRYKNATGRQDVAAIPGNYLLTSDKVSTTKMFGSASFVAYSIGDFAIIPDIYGGTWKTKFSDDNQSQVTYDPFFNFGVMFQTTWSKYFKGYIRPSFEVRSYTLTNDPVIVKNKFSIFSIDLGLILKYPTYPRNKYKADMVQMEHVFNGKMYRGRPFYRKQNPRTGQRRNTKKGSGYSFPRKKN